MNFRFFHKNNDEVNKFVYIFLLKYIKNYCKKIKIQEKYLFKIFKHIDKLFKK